MTRAMKKNIPVFVAVSAAAMMAAYFAIPVSRTFAYAIGPIGPIGPMGSTTPSGGGRGYDFGSSLQNLISPFTGFINDLKWNNGTAITPGGMSGYTPPQGFSMGTGVGPAIINMLTGWLNDFNNWVYAHTGIELSGIIYVFLNVLSWVLHIVQAIVNWLLGLFH